MKLPVIRVKQWLPDWDAVDFSEGEFRRKPEDGFYIFSISARLLKRLSAVYRRTSEGRESGSAELHIQRQHDPRRSSEIGRFVRWGYPWSDMSEAQRESDENRTLQKPGWLPTSVVVNILRKEDSRDGLFVRPEELVTISREEGCLVLPDGVDDTWSPKGIPPVEIIDGQHRLWAFEDSELDFEVPVVAFVGLDLSWQAYLFWTINIKPKKINPSLAYDLYPLLRAQNWLDGFNGPVVYREARAQELVELLWSTSDSPWYRRINMLGERGVKAQVTQAAWIRTLLATFIKPWKNPESRLGGFYGVVSDGAAVLPWSRTQQAMFLMLLGRKILDAIKINEDRLKWVSMIADGCLTQKGFEAFVSPKCMLNLDQGIRGLLDATNSILCILYAELKDEYLSLRGDGSEEIESVESFSAMIAKLAPKLLGLIDAYSMAIASYDWRSFEAPFGVDAEEDRLKIKRAGFRGSGGYRLIYEDLMDHLLRVSREPLLTKALERLAAISK